MTSAFVRRALMCYRHLYVMEAGHWVYDLQDLHMSSMAVLSLQLQIPSQLHQIESLFEKLCAEREMHLSLYACLFL